jgi:hypothetical protein
MALVTQARVSNHLSACNAQADRQHDLDDDRRTPACADTADRHDEYRQTEGIVPRFEHSSCIGYKRLCDHIDPTIYCFARVLLGQL